MPEAGEAYLSPDEASQQRANFLRQELESRLRNGPVVFRHCQLKEMFTSIIVVLSNLTVDLLYTWLDPRIRY